MLRWGRTSSSGQAQGQPAGSAAAARSSPKEGVRRSAGRQGSSLERKLLLWTLLLALSPTLLCAMWTRHVAERAMGRGHAEAALELARLVAATALDRGVTVELGDTPGRQLHALMLDPRLAFVQITDQHGQVCFEHTADESAWTSYELWRSRMGPGGANEMGRPIFPNDSGDLVVWQLALWGEPEEPTLQRHETISDEDVLVRAAAFGRAAPRLEGTLILATRDPRQAATVAYLMGWQLASAAIACMLLLPAVMWMVGRWVQPLRELVAATSKLAHGIAPRPVIFKSGDEIGQLAREFNRMARRLHAMRLRLQRANETLEGQVEQRTAELQSAKRRLESEIRDKNEFLRAVSHDLGAPLRNIGGMASMLLSKYRQSLSDDVLTKLERISANVKTQSDLIGDLLELSLLRTRQGRPERIDLNELLAEVRTSLAFDLERQNVTLAVESSLPTIRAERNRIRQIFQNLLDNAIKYMGSSEVRRVTVRCDEGDGLYRFAVSDTGMGIGREDRDKVFRVFARGRLRGDAIPGRGVGLAGVKTIVECYGGTIWVESEPGEGATFHFTLDRNAVGVGGGQEASNAVHESPRRTTGMSM